MGDEFKGLDPSRFFKRGTSSTVTDDQFVKFDDEAKRDCINERCADPAIKGLYAEHAGLLQQRNYCGGSYFDSAKQEKLRTVETALKPHMERVALWSRLLDEQLESEREARDRAQLKTIRRAR